MAPNRDDFPSKERKKLMEGLYFTRISFFFLFCTSKICEEGTFRAFERDQKPEKKESSPCVFVFVSLGGTIHSTTFDSVYHSYHEPFAQPLCGTVQSFVALER